MDNLLENTIINNIGLCLIGGLSVLLLAINKKISCFLINVVWRSIKKQFIKETLKKHEINKDSKIREILIELRTIVNADRACLFQFHNGSTFTAKNPIWKVSNTHESVAPGISSEIGNLQDIKASSMIETLQSFWSEDYKPGVEKISPEYCGECSKSCIEHGKKVIFINVEELEDSYSKSLLVEQGITCVIDVPIYNGEDNCVGFVAINYCGERDVENIKVSARDVCRNASQIQFLLLQ